MRDNVHKLSKQLEREKQHQQWLDQNLKHSHQHSECLKNILKLQTEIACKELGQTSPKI